MINVTTEKNKNSSSKHTISVVFDKRNGIDKFWSNFVFLSTHTPSEVMLFRDNKVDEFYPLLITTEGAYSKLEVISPETGEIEYTSKKFYKKNAKTLYDSDEEFKKWFDIGVDYSCKERISKGLLKVNTNKIDDLSTMSSEENLINPTDNLNESEMTSNAAEVKDVVEEKPKKRGRKKKETIAPTSEDTFVSESSILEEGSN